MEALASWSPVPELEVNSVERREPGWLVAVDSRESASCPQCGTRASSRHSSYLRTQQDLSTQGTPVTIQARVTRWRCRNEQCGRRIFSLLISNGSTAFQARNNDVSLLASEIVQLDTLLRRYGPEAGTARDALQRYATMTSENLFPDSPDRHPDVDNTATLKTLDEVQDLVLAFRSSDDRQHWLSAQALQLTVAASETRARMSQEDLRSVPLPFLGAVVLWLTVLFVSFGLFAPRNVTVIIAVFLCAFAIAAAIKLVLDMDTPFDGLIRLSRPPIHISSDPLLRAIQVIRR